ncbi:hypothetical protein [Photorhabdus sp. CRCIA-P01]|uniref:hypothetical protein n=1 Tax=Photorhabdus sp. CRCIA-P01 TaxID=2019570 RepID=UPI0018E55FF0|nr:hypothetical protein [Photorhabdus sp. CRCIA-P01]
MRIRQSDQLEKEAKSLVKRHALPKFILQELLDYCLNNNLLRPAYSTMQNIVSCALRQEQQRLNNKFYAKIEPTIRSQLDNLLNMDDLFYKLTLIKKDQKDFHKPNLNRDFYRWEWYGQQSLVIKRNLRPIFKILEFTCTNIELRSAVTFFKRYLLEGGVNFHSISMDDIPFDFFPKAQRHHLFYKIKSIDGKQIKSIDSGRYEFMLYFYLMKGIENGTVFIRDSNNFRSLEDELINAEVWKRDKEKILSQLNMPLLKHDIANLLEIVEISLENKYHAVNTRIQHE